jgi:hypothetical protein
VVASGGRAGNRVVSITRATRPRLATEATTVPVPRAASRQAADIPGTRGRRHWQIA